MKKKPLSPTRIAIFRKQEIRKAIHNNEWWFVIADVVAALTDSVQPDGYIKDMRRRDPELSKGWVQIATPLSIQTQGGPQKLNCANTEGETVWLTQKQMAEIFDKDTDTIGLHIRNVYKEKELDRNSTTEESSVVQVEGGRQVQRAIRFYNLDMILSVGYRVNSKRGTQFRIWATSVLRKHLVDGYTVNEKRLRAAQEKYLELRRSISLLENLFVMFGGCGRIVFGR